MKYIITGLVVLVLVLVGYIAYINYDIRVQKSKEAAYWKTKTFKIDTVYKSSTYTNNTHSEDKYLPIPAKETIIYRSEIPQAFLDKTERLLRVIDSINGTKTEVSESFITLHPTSPKFLGGTFTGKGISLDLLDINGITRTDNYPVDYSVFDYDFHNNSMNVTKSSTSDSKKIAKKNFISFDGVNFDYKHDLLRAQNRAELNLGLNVWRFRAGAFADYPIGNSNLNKNPSAGFKLGIRLF